MMSLSLLTPTIAGRLGLSLAPMSTVRVKPTLVTGAGGTIGKAVCGSLLGYIVGMDRDAERLASCPALLRHAIDVGGVHPKGLSPRYVVHCAAAKHVSACETDPVAADWDNRHACEQVTALYPAASMVCVSTDKACDPVGVYGRSKAMGEGYFLERHQTVIRLVNVLGSSGSVLELWHSQIAAGKPITVTDPDATRMFMSLPMAVEQIVAAMLTPRREGGQIILAHGYVLVRVGDLARMVCEEMGQADYPVEIIGLRPGERKHEILHDERYGAAVL